jgi:hypothetical protein
MLAIAVIRSRKCHSLSSYEAARYPLKRYDSLSHPVNHHTVLASATHGIHIRMYGGAATNLLNDGYLRVLQLNKFGSQNQLLPLAIYWIELRVMLAFEEFLCSVLACSKEQGAYVPAFLSALRCTPDIPFCRLSSQINPPQFKSTKLHKTRDVQTRLFVSIFLGLALISRAPTLAPSAA